MSLPSPPLPPSRFSCVCVFLDRRAVTETNGVNPLKTNTSHGKNREANTTTPPFYHTTLLDQPPRALGVCAACMWKLFIVCVLPPPTAPQNAYISLLSLPPSTIVAPLLPIFDIAGLSTFNNVSLTLHGERCRGTSPEPPGTEPCHSRGGTFGPNIL